MFYMFTVCKGLGDDCHPDLGCDGDNITCTDRVCSCNPPYTELEDGCGKGFKLHSDVDYFQSVLLLIVLPSVTAFEVSGTPFNY